MTKITTSILPEKNVFAKVDSHQEIDKMAICIFVAIGFFMDDDTYYKNLKCLLPSHTYVLDEEGYIKSKKKNFEWFHEPRQVNFSAILEEYTQLLTTIVAEQTNNKRVILPLSGGLDSRSQALVLKTLGREVESFSYAFKGGYREDKIASKIADSCGFNFRSFKIATGYLWDHIDELAIISGCYSEFTHPRQMAVIDDLKKMKGTFSLGHWGDVLFDSGAPITLNETDVVSYIVKKIVKPKGLLLAEALWKDWDIQGGFKEYLIERIKKQLSGIQIDNVSSKIRAYKTTQWAHRWTTNNLSVFHSANETTLPYYDDRMLKFICSVPEKFLADRVLQIAHLKTDKSLSSITWQSQRPFNLKNYSLNRFPYNLPYKIKNKSIRIFKTAVGSPYIQRNWELQFLGKNNDRKLQENLYDAEFLKFIDKRIIDDFYKNFKRGDSINYAHPVSMLLTLSKWYQINLNSPSN